MHNTVKNLIYIEELIKSRVNLGKFTKIIAVSKTFPIKNVMPLIEHGHLHYGENKVQEALDKWSEIKLKVNDIKLHLIGRLQTNKVKFAIRIFDYIHSLDSEKLATKISEEEIKQKKKPAASGHRLRTNLKKHPPPCEKRLRHRCIGLEHKEGRTSAVRTLLPIGDFTRPTDFARLKISPD